MQFSPSSALSSHRPSIYVSAFAATVWCYYKDKYATVHIQTFFRALSYWRKLKYSKALHTHARMHAHRRGKYELQCNNLQDL